MSDPDAFPATHGHEALRGVIGSLAETLGFAPHPDDSDATREFWRAAYAALLAEASAAVSGVTGRDRTEGRVEG